MKNKIKIYEILIGLLLFIGIIVCTICDITISNTYTWSLVPISSIIFGGIALFPVVKFGKKGIWASLLVLNTCIITYLYVLKNMVKDDELIYTVGIRMATISVIYLICIFVIFKIFKKKKFLATGCSLLIGIPICIIVNYNLSKMFSQALFDIWDILSILTLFILSMIFFMYHLNTSRD